VRVESRGDGGVRCAEQTLVDMTVIDRGLLDYDPGVMTVRHVARFATLNTSNATQRA
jgi:hypothetical protein